VEVDPGSDSDFVSDNEAVVEYQDNDDEWAKSLQKWEHQKAEALMDLVQPESMCCDKASEWNGHDEEDGHEESDEELINKTQDELPRYHRHGEAESSVNRSSECSKAFPEQDGKGETIMVDVTELRYSQVSCKETFQCGRHISELVSDLLRGRVSLSAPFLQLTVFESEDQQTDANGRPILKCADNRRLYALKEYAKKSRGRVLVQARYYSQHTLQEARRIDRNNDRTPGLSVFLRKDKQKQKVGTGKGRQIRQNNWPRRRRRNKLRR